MKCEIPGVKKKKEEKKKEKGKREMERELRCLVLGGDWGSACLQAAYEYSFLGSLPNWV